MDIEEIMQVCERLTTEFGRDGNFPDASEPPERKSLIGGRVVERLSGDLPPCTHPSLRLEQVQRRRLVLGDVYVCAPKVTNGSSNCARRRGVNGCYESNV